MCSAGGVIPRLRCLRYLLYFIFFCWTPGSPHATFTVAGSGGRTVPAPLTAHQEFLCHEFLAPAMEEIWPWPCRATHPSQCHYLGRVVDTAQNETVSSESDFLAYQGVFNTLFIWVCDKGNRVNRPGSQSSWKPEMLGAFICSLWLNTPEEIFHLSWHH